MLEGVTPEAAWRAADWSEVYWPGSGKAKLEPNTMVTTDFEILGVGHQASATIASDWHGGTNVLVRCTRETSFPGVRERLPEEERILLGRLIECILRGAGGKVASGNVEGIENIRPVPVHIDETGATVDLDGLTGEKVLAVLDDEALAAIAVSRGRRIGSLTRLSDGMEVHFEWPSMIIGAPLLPTYLVEVRQAEQQTHLRASAWNYHAPRTSENPAGKAPLPGAKAEWLARELAIYVLGKVSTARIVPEAE